MIVFAVFSSILENKIFALKFLLELRVVMMLRHKMNINPFYFKDV